MTDNTQRKFHANKLQLYRVHIDKVGVIFEGDEHIGEVQSVPFERDIEIAQQKYNLSHLSEKQKFDPANVLLKHDSMFTNKPGLCVIGMHEIRLKQNYTSKRKVPYRLPERLRSEVDRQIKDLLQAGLIESSQSPYASLIVCVAKYDSSIRIYCDYRDINSGTIDCIFPMKNVQDMLMKIGHCA